MESINKYFILFLFISWSSFAAQEPIKELKQKLQLYKAGVSEVRREMNSLGKLIKNKNNKLIDILQKKTAMQNQIIEMEHSYQQDFEAYFELKKELRNKLKRIALNQFESTNDQGFFKNVLIRHKIKKQLGQVKKDETKLSELREQILVYQNQLKQLENFETDLNVKIVTLESKQEDYMTTYQNRLGRTSEITKKIKAELAKQNAFFHEPIDQYSKRTSNKKGVYYTVQGRQQVTAAKAGKVIYVGSMANYGNVIMIQHAKSKISVYLGQFSPKIKESTSVEQGDIIGYTELTSDRQGNVYFEIRHNNIPQKTLPLIQKV